MTVTSKAFIQDKTAETVQATQYTAANSSAIIDKFTVTNNGAGNASISVNLVPNGASAAASNLVINARTLAPKETYSAYELAGHVLDAGGSISTLASAGSSLTLRASGREIT